MFLTCIPFLRLEVALKIKPKALPPPLPKFEFSLPQKLACEKSKLVANRLAAMQTGGKFNYGYSLKDQQPLKIYNLAQHFFAAHALIKMSDTRSHAHNLYHDYNFVHCIIAADNAIQWALKKYLQPAKPTKYQPEPKLLVKGKINLDASAAALLALSTMIGYMTHNKYTMMVTWRIENHMNYLKQGESLAQGLYTQINKDGSIASGNKALILQALFAWVGVCQSLSAWYNHLKTDSWFTYKNRPLLYKSLSLSVTDDEAFIGALAMALRNVTECAPYETAFIKQLKKLLKHAKDSNSMLAAMHYFGLFSDGQYKDDAERIVQRVTIDLKKSAKRIKKTGSVSQNNVVSIAYMQAMLIKLHGLAVYKPYYA